MPLPDTDQYTLFAYVFLHMGKKEVHFKQHCMFAEARLCAVLAALVSLACTGGA